MDFGKVTSEELTTIDLQLPNEPAWNKHILTGKKVADPKVYVGCAKWGRVEWVGKIYPEKTKEAKFLDHYVQHYNSIELNATHYKTYEPLAIKKWADKAEGKDFLFCPKVPQSISHFSSFVNIDEKTDSFLESVYAFEKHLGPIFLQVSDKFSPRKKENLLAYLQSLPKDLQFFLEVRNAEWYADNNENENLVKTLHKLGVGNIITDAAGRRDCAHMQLTVPKTFIRFVGNSLHPTDFTRIDNWAERIKLWLDDGLQELYFFMHMHDEATSPELSSYLVKKLNEVCGLSLPDPLFISHLADEPVKKTTVPRKPTQVSKDLFSE